MIIFVDESGDLGFKFTKGSSVLFVLGVLAFSEERLTLDFLRKFKKWLAKQPDLNKLDELKFSKLNREKRILILSYIESQKVRTIGIVANKATFRGTSEQLLMSTYQALFKVIKPSKRIVINIDGEMSKGERNKMVTALRSQLLSVVLKAKFHDSRSDKLLQVADLVAGVTVNIKSGKSDGKLYRRVLGSLEIVVT